MWGVRVLDEFGGSWCVVDCGVCGVWYVGYVGIVGYVGGPGISLTELAQAIDGKLRVFFLWIGLKIGRQMRLVSNGGFLLVCYYWRPKWRVTRQSDVGIQASYTCRNSAEHGMCSALSFFLFSL